tara:strand:- start:3305 stop:3931 length:627 start_codon:yes stop_codon:yes gene_type:complete
MTIVIKQAAPSDAADLAHIHVACLPEDFLPSLGAGFMEKQYYPAALASTNALTFMAMDGERPVGFVTVASDSYAFSRDAMRGRIAALARHAILRALRQPSHLLLSAQVLLAATKPRTHEFSGEIVFIGVIPGIRRQGVGRRLIAAAMAFLQNIPVRRCRTKTLARNLNVIGLYQSLGWQIVDRFTLIGNDYVTLLSPQEHRELGVDQE